MPTIFIPNKEKFENITRPVAISMTRQILRLLDINENIKIQYTDMHNKAIQYGSAMGDDPDKTVSWANDNKVSLEVEEAYFEDRLASQLIHRAEHQFIFQDDDLEVYVKPVYSTVRVRMTLHCRADGRNKATRWRDDLKQRMTDGRDAHLYQAIYSYQIPPVIQNVIDVIHGYRERIAGYGEDLPTYFRNHSDPRITVITPRDGIGGELVVPETQGEIVGLFDFTLPERGTKNDDGSQAFSIELPFTFMYEQPIGCEMSFPHYVHNQWMEEFNEQKQDEPDAPLYNVQRRSLMSAAMKYFQAGQSTYKNRKVQGFQVPWNDEFLPESIIPGTLRVFTVLTSITPTDKRNLFNLTDNLLDGHVFDPDVLAFIRKEQPYLIKPYFSVFNLSLYQQRKMAHYTALEIDADLNVRATSDLDLRSPYHVRFSFVYDWSLLSQDAKDRLTDSGIAIGKIIDGFQPPIKPPVLIGDGYLPPKEIDRIEDDLVPLNGSGRDLHMKTIETFYIRTFKEKQ